MFTLGMPPFFLPILASSMEDYREKMLIQIAKNTIETFLVSITSIGHFFPEVIVPKAKATEKDVQDIKAEYKDSFRVMVRHMFKLWRDLELEAEANMREAIKQAQTDKRSEHV